MSTTTAPVTLATLRYAGAYGFTFEHRLVRHGQRHYLLFDHFAGDNVEGSCPRTFVYALTLEQAEEILPYLDPRCLVLDERGQCSFDYLRTFVLPTLDCEGRQDRLQWAEPL